MEFLVSSEAVKRQRSLSLICISDIISPIFSTKLAPACQIALLLSCIYSLILQFYISLEFTGAQTGTGGDSSIVVMSVSSLQVLLVVMSSTAYVLCHVSTCSPTLHTLWKPTSMQYSYQSGQDARNGGRRRRRRR